MKKLMKFAGIVVGLFVGIAVIAGIAGGGGTDSTTTATDTADTDAEPEATQAADTTEGDTEQAAENTNEGEPETAAVGDPARDGKFEFTITDVETGVETVGEEFMETTASGEYVILTMTVANIGDEAQALFADNQYLIDDQDREFSADFDAGIALESPLFEEINPGNSVEGKIAFDVPTDATIEHAQLHDSAFSGGIVVDLT